MGSNKVTFGTLISIVIIIIGIYYRNSDRELRTRLTHVLNGLEHLETKHEIAVRPKIAVGYGACADVFIDAKYLINYSPKIGAPEHYDEINSRDELLKSFAYYFRHGAAAERYMRNEELFDKLVMKARSFDSSYSAIGGNAPVMAMRFAKEGCEVLLAAKMTRNLRLMIPDNIEVVGGEVDRDDVHLILEYKRGERWGPYTSARANRYIIHNDNNNPTVSSLEEFDKALPEFKPDLLVVSGLQMMDNYPFDDGVRHSRLEKIKQQMIDQLPTTRIHFEMASFVEKDLVTDLENMILPYADSLGMNEQEIANLYNSMYYGNISLVADSSPRVATILDYMRVLFKLVRMRGREIDGARELTRIHVHTLAYQAIMTVKNSPWKNTMAAAAKASLVAHRHVCGTSNIDVKKATLIMDDSFSTSKVSGKRIPLDIEKPVSCWDEILKTSIQDYAVEVCVAPVLVCTEASQTAGGGDNISSAGLVLQI
ncbi:ADP-dependent glucokinase [Microplitis demolitor]|uniref:ADP-dependent glucokinase n=1 Tax=Microplitis demolitor TaxID=69319 RepID=UPI0004CD9D88|nr:ADP-dependent glucokinase [Microplitis demolitor]